MSSVNRSIGFFDALLRKPAPTPALDAATPAPAPKPQTDRLTMSGPAHERFKADARLGSVLAGTALAAGEHGPAVAKVQQALSDMAFYVHGGADGAFGPATAQAVKNFQSMAGLPQTGAVDAATFKALDKFAPPAGKTSWSEGADPGPVPDPAVNKTKKARAVVDLSQHRLFLFDKKGHLEKIYPVRSGAVGTATQAGVKVVDGKNDNPKSVSDALWPDAGGRAFGTRLLNLTDYDPATNRAFKGAHVGQELHGTYQDASIGRDFSHGCVGLRNTDIEEIFETIGNGELVKFQR